MDWSEPAPSTLPLTESDPTPVRDSEAGLVIARYWSDPACGFARPLATMCTMNLPPPQRPCIVLASARSAERSEMRQLLSAVDAELVELDSAEALEAYCSEHLPALALISWDGPPAADGEWHQQVGETPALYFLPGTSDEDQRRLQRLGEREIDYLVRPVAAHALLPKVRVYLNAHRHRMGLQTALEQLYERGREVQELQDTFRKLAYEDSLTGLPNRLLFMDRLSSAITRAERSKAKLALLFVDIDGFKAVNDTHGHAAGDELLKQIAVRMTAAVRKSDTVARLGGDEFAVILEQQYDALATMAVGEKICSAVLHRFELPTDPAVVVTVGCSIGVVIYPNHGTDPDALLHAADAAMYKVKRRGKGGVMVSGAD